MSIKRRLLLICSFLALFPIMSFGQIDLPSIQKITKQGKLIVSINMHDSPPMFSANEQGELVGYDIELAKYLAENLGVPVEFIRTAQTFNEVVDTVSDGKADIAVSLLTPNLERARTVYFSDPYLYLNKLLVFNRLAAAQHKVSDPANQIQTIKNLKIGVLNGSSYIGYAKEYYPDATLVYFPAVPDAISAVEAGEIFGFFGNSANVPFALKANSSMNLYVGVSQLKNKVDPIAIAISGNYPDLLTWINLALALRKEKGISDFEKEYANTEAR